MATFFLFLFMIIRPSTNPQKRMYHAIVYAVLRKKDSYCAIDYEGVEK
jgi:hypothetical protein